MEASFFLLSGSVEPKVFSSLFWVVCCYSKGCELGSEIFVDILYINPERNEFSMLIHTRGKP